jgi:hypothetical protein
MNLKSHLYDIVRREDDTHARWLESASDLRAAESRIEELTSVWPGEFQVVDQQTHQVVARIARPPQDVRSRRA